MTLRNILLALNFVVICAALAFGAVLTQKTWYPVLFPTADAEPEEDDHHAGEEDRVKLSTQAQRSLGLQIKSVQLLSDYPLGPAYLASQVFGAQALAISGAPMAATGQLLVVADVSERAKSSLSYPRKIRIPGKIIPQPGKTIVKVATPITGLVEEIFAYPGQTIKPGDPMFRLHLHYHDVHTIQADLYKTGKELQIADEEYQRLKKLGSIAIPEAKLLELEYQKRKLEAKLYSLKANLELHLFTDKEIKQIIKGDFVSHWTIKAPSRKHDHETTTPVAAVSSRPNKSDEEDAAYEVGDLEVKLGDQVGAGQTLCLLANHEYLFVEARVFLPEIPLVEKTVKKEADVEVEIMDLTGEHSTKLSKPLQILYLDQHIDSDSQSVGAYLKLPNQFQAYSKEGSTYRIWKYRPGQRVYVTIPVENFTNVFVVPAGAVAEESAEHYVFRQNGDVFVRKPVHVILKDNTSAVIANDGSIFPGDRIAFNGADQLLRALKAGEQQGHAGHHHHH